MITHVSTSESIPYQRHIYVGIAGITVIANIIAVHICSCWQDSAAKDSVSRVAMATETSQQHAMYACSVHTMSTTTVSLKHMTLFVSNTRTRELNIVYPFSTMIHGALTLPDAPSPITTNFSCRSWLSSSESDMSKTIICNSTLFVLTNKTN